MTDDDDEDEEESWPLLFLDSEDAISIPARLFESWTKTISPASTISPPFPPALLPLKTVRSLFLLPSSASTSSPSFRPQTLPNNSPNSFLSLLQFLYFGPVVNQSICFTSSSNPSHANLVSSIVVVVELGSRPARSNASSRPRKARRPRKRVLRVGAEPVRGLCLVEAG